MVNLEYANAYSEVLEILKYIPKEDYDKIDKELIDVFLTNHNVEYKFEYNPKKTLKQQNVSKKTKTIIAILFRDYWSSEVQKQKILAKEKYDFETEEEKRRKLYNLDNIFKNRQVSSEPVAENMQMVEYKKSTWYKKIFEKILSIFKRN